MLLHGDLKKQHNYMEYIRKQFVTKKPTSVKLIFSKVYTLSKGQNHILISSFQSRMMSKHFLYLVHSVHVCMFNIDFASVDAVSSEL